MTKTLLMVFCLLFALIYPGYSQQQSDSSDSSTEIAGMKAEIKELKSEIDCLKAEVKVLRAELNEMSDTVTAISAPVQSSENHPGKAISGETGYRCTKSGKRHNSSCRYYRTTNGRPCGPHDGTPCKLCGG